MNNYEYLKNITIEQMSHFLCQMVEDEFYKTHGDNEWQCDKCPVRDKCEAARMNGNGWFHWLREEAEC